MWKCSVCSAAAGNIHINYSLTKEYVYAAKLRVEREETNTMNHPGSQLIHSRASWGRPGNIPDPTAFPQKVLIPLLTLALPLLSWLRG